MSRAHLALALLTACSSPSGDPSGSPPAPADPPPRGEAPAPAPPPDETPAWLRTLLAHDLSGRATDARTIALGQRLGAPIVCPQPGTGCFVELELAGHTTQLHLGDDEVIQIWGPTEHAQMPAWVEGVEREIDRSSLEALNEPGTRPDRLWRSRRRVVLLHDHTGQRCGGFCPAMIWIALPSHPSARGYGFTTR
ncbi:MAG: hypothetical protein KF729_35095 [Sandaracinaceae bacterium]|nr:hypothetical protein [Sandaracinaceae bacterium]